MKKIIFLSILTALTAISHAQIVSRFGTVPGSDNTGRVLTWGYITPLLPTSDSIRITSGYYKEIIQPAQLTAAAVVCADTTKKRKPLANAYVGDEQVFIFNANTHSGGWAVSFGYGYVTTTSFTVGSAKTATISFVFDGTLWRETSRSIE